MEKTCNLKGNAAAHCTSFESGDVTSNVIRRWQGLGCVKWWELISLFVYLSSESENHDFSLWLFTVGFYYQPQLPSF